MGMLMMVTVGDGIFRALNMQVPQFYQERIQNNKWTWGIASWFIGNQVASGLLSTGAFEIFVNDELEYSKLASGKMPDLGVINKIFEKYQI